MAETKPLFKKRGGSSYSTFHNEEESSTSPKGRNRQSTVIHIVTMLGALTAVALVAALGGVLVSNTNALMSMDRAIANRIEPPDLATQTTLMNTLYGAFQAVDNGFNVHTATPGLTVPEIIALGYFRSHTSVMALGPFTPDVHGMHTNHNNMPGAFHAIGEAESAYLQLVFEGGILTDPNFPWDTTLQQDKHPKIYHTRPVITDTIGSNDFYVLATALVTYASNNVPPTGTTAPWVPGNGTVVATIKSIAVYSFDPSNTTAIPWINWIHFSIVYQDRPLRRLVGNNPFATTNGSGNVVVSVPGGAINTNPPMVSPVAVGDVIAITGLVTSVNGIPAADINGNRTVTAVTANTFTFVAGSGSLATATGTGGGLGGPDGIIVDKA